jgi:hypothetical protein
MLETPFQNHGNLINVSSFISKFVSFCFKQVSHQM